jgi:hypothetical protein
LLLLFFKKNHQKFLISQNSGKKNPWLSLFVGVSKLGIDDITFTLNSISLYYSQIKSFFPWIVLLKINTQNKKHTHQADSSLLHFQQKTNECTCFYFIFGCVAYYLQHACTCCINCHHLGQWRWLEMAKKKKHTHTQKV